MKITFVGGGNMGSALISGLIRNGADRKDISVIEPDPERREKMKAEYGISVFESVDLLDCDLILLAVKPQQLFGVASALADKLSSQIVVSIAAGILTSDLSRWLKGYGRIIRVMPNTPAQVMKGISALYAMPQVSAQDRRMAEEVLSSVGSTIWLIDEGKMDAFTALCGSGPAYVFYFLEALIEAGTEMGFDAIDAKKMALETFSGAVALASESQDEPGILRKKVTSKGGTTERALLEMENSSVKEHVVQAIRAAEERSKELGIELGKTSC